MEREPELVGSITSRAAEDVYWKAGTESAATLEVDIKATPHVKMSKIFATI